MLQPTNRVIVYDSYKAVLDATNGLRSAQRRTTEVTAIANALREIIEKNSMEEHLMRLMYNQTNPNQSVNH